MSKRQQEKKEQNAMSSEKSMSIQDIMDIVNKYGNDGLIAKQRCIDLPIGIEINGKTYIQVVNFNDGKRPLALTWLNEDDWDFRDPYEEVDKKVRDKVEEYLKTLVNEG